MPGTFDIDEGALDHSQKVPVQFVASEADFQRRKYTQLPLHGRTCDEHDYTKIDPAIKRGRAVGGPRKICPDLLPTTHMCRGCCITLTDPQIHLAQYAKIQYIIPKDMLRHSFLNTSGRVETLAGQRSSPRQGLLLSGGCYESILSTEWRRDWQMALTQRITT